MLVLQILRRNTHIFFTNAKLSILSGISWLWMAKTFYPFVLNAPFIYPLKTSENLMVFWCFQGVDMGALRRNGSRNIFHYFSKCVSNSRSFDTIVLKVASAIKHKNTAEEIIIYTHLQSLLFIIKAWKKTKYNILTFTFTAARLGTPTSLLICVQFISQREATQIWRLWRSMKIRQNSENLFTKKF